MCTATWLFDDDGYELFFNRDELRTRPPAHPPRLAEAAGVRYLAPEDGEAGGSWIAVNEHGFSVCLLNLYHARISTAQARPDGSPFTSRGRLVLDLASCGSIRDFLRTLGTMDLSAWRPFTLLALASSPERGTERGRGKNEQGDEERAHLVEWDGVHFADLGPDPPLPLISSGYDFAGAARHRRAVFAAFLAEDGSPGSPPGRQTLARYHRGHQPERGPYSVCMHRDDARTVSFTRVRVRPDSISMSYAPGPPCVTPEGEPTFLARSGVAVAP